MMGTSQLVIIETTEISLSAAQAYLATLRLWKSLARKTGGVRIRRIRISRRPGEVIRHLRLLQRADQIVFPYLTPTLIDVLGFLRGPFGLATPCVFFLHGHSSSGPGFFLAFDRYLQRHDQFLVSSGAESKTLRLCLKRPREIFVPYLPHVHRSLRLTAAPVQTRTFVYVGRISSQKNLDVLVRAFSLLRRRLPNERLTLEIYGREDQLGTPEFGIPARKLLADLKKIEEELKVGGIRWMGFRTQAQLDRGILGRRHVFVSASTHVGENYGLAAYRAMALGNSAVLSAWGGHRDFIHVFGGQVHAVEVSSAADGKPEVSVKKFSRAMEAALRASDRGHSVRRARKAVEKLESMAIKSLSSALYNRIDPAPVTTTAHYDALRRRFRNGRGKVPVYRGYKDPLARPLLRVLGLTRAHPRSTACS